MKYFEIRDRATFIAVLAIRPLDALSLPVHEFPIPQPARQQVVQHGLARSGYQERRSDGPLLDEHIILVRLDTVQCQLCSEMWPREGRTIILAHEYIEKHWAVLRTGDVIDVEFNLGETEVKKTPDVANGPSYARGIIFADKTEYQPQVFRYAPKYRPPGYATVPDNWRLVSRGKTVDAFERRTDLPVGDSPFGVIEYDRPLSPQQVRAYELLPVPSLRSAGTSGRSD